MAKNLLKTDLDFILEKTEGIWDELRGQKIFITGGTGFFGCWLLESFAWANNKLGLNASATVLTRNPEAFRLKAPHLCDAPAISFLKGNVRSFTFPDEEFPYIIHAATGVEADSSRQDPISLFEGMVEGTRRILDFAGTCGARKILITSSGAVYGKQPNDLEAIPEEFIGAPETTNPVAAYGEAKRVSEFLAAMFSERYGFEAKMARCFAFVGPYLPLDGQFAIGNFIGNVLRNEPINIKGDGTPYRSYMYAADLAIWLWTILFKGRSCRSYNVGSAAAITIADLAGLVADVSGSRQGVHISHKPLPGQLPERYLPSTQRARDELGLRQNIDLAEAIRRTVSWFSKG